MALGFHADARQPESDECLEDSAAARIAAFLGGGRAPAAIIHCKYAVDLFCGQARGRGSEDGTFSPSWGGPLVPPGPPKSSRGHFRNLKSGQVEKSHEAKAPIPAYLQWIVTRRSEADEGPKDTQQPPKK